MKPALPKGWTTRALYDCANYINGAAFRDEHFSADRQGLPVIKIGELKDGVTAQTKFCEIERESKYRIDSGDILFSWSGSPDTSIDIFIWTEGEGWLNQHIFNIQFKRPIERCFVYYLLRHLIRTTHVRRSVGPERSGFSTRAPDHSGLIQTQPCS